MRNKLRAIHPGEILAEEISGLDLSANLLAKALNVPTNRITAIINGQRSISADTALRLACYFGTTAEFWLNLQTSYDLKMVTQQMGKKIKHEVHARKAA